MKRCDLEKLRETDLAERRFIVGATDRSMLVEAAAGTGKTTLMVDRILQALCEGALELSRTVAITFTEKAAAELAARLRRKLAGELGRKDLPERVRARLEKAVDEVDAANVSTIHAFCATLLRHRPAEAAVDPMFEVLDATQAGLLRDKCWQQWMAEQARRTDCPLTEALRAGVTMAALRELADAATGSPEALDPAFVAPPAAVRSAEELLAELRGLAQQAALLVKEKVRAKTNQDCRALIAALDAVLAAPALDEVLLRRAGYALAAASVDKALTSFPKDVRDQVRDAVVRAQAPARALGAELAVRLLAWAGEFVAFYQAAKRRRGALDFQDLLLAAARMLRDSNEARAYFRTRFRTFFVDEFQDTDPLQAEVIAFLSESEAGTPARRWEDVRIADGRLFVVGDPKQSIYRFRRADVQVYEQFKALFRRLPAGDEAVREISQNWRSCRPLIEALNALFEQVFRPSDDPDVYQARHVALVASPKSDAPGPAVVAVYPPDLPEDAMGRAPQARRLEAGYLARVVRDLVAGAIPPEVKAAVDGRPLRYGDFAFLLRALTDVGTYEQALESCGVPYRVIGGKNFYEREEVGQTIAVLRAVDDPLDDVNVVAALRSSYFGLSDEDLMRYHEAGGRWTYTHEGATDVGGPVAEAMGLLAGWHAARAGQAPHLLLRRIWDLTRAREAFMLKPAGARRVANVEKLLSQMRALWGASAGSFRDVVDYLALLHERREEEPESSVVEPGDDFVLLMSIHKAKGLEFNAVCLPDLARRPIGAPPPLIMDRLKRKVETSLSAAVRTEGFDDLAAHEAGNLAAERRRLLYVAATRARRLLLLPMHWQEPTPESMLATLLESGLFLAPDEAPFGSEHNGVHYWDTRPWAEEVKPDLSPVRKAAARADESAAAELLAERARWIERRDRILRRAGRCPPILAPSRMAGESTVRVSDPAGRAESGGVDGPAFGTLFHNLMQGVPLPAACRGDVANLEGLVSGLAHIEAEGLGLGQEAVEEAGRLARRALQNEEFREIVAGATVVRPEVPFAIPLSALPLLDEGRGGVLEGSIDLLLAGDGGTVIVDYKTDRLPPEATAAAAERYWPQLALYALALAAAGRGAGATQLVLFFVRPGVLARRSMSVALLQDVQARVPAALGRAAGGPGPT